MLEKKEKCYRVIKNSDSPCADCPVASQQIDPYTYTDPVRHTTDTIDAVEMQLADGTTGYALVFSNIEKDELTGLYTKQAFLYHAKRLLSENLEESFDIIISDLNNFKRINRVYGEDKGDEVLRSIAELVKAHTEDGICARYGADMFISIQKSVQMDRKEWVQNILNEYTKQAPVANLVLKTGIYQNVDRNLSVSQMCDRALLALKSVKHNHDRNVAMFDGPLSQQLLREQGYEAVFQEALEQKEFVVYYQPKYNPYTEKIVGAEALVRWIHEGKMMPPGVFLNVFEENGLISQLDEYVFQEVCAYQSGLKKRGIPLIPISVNISRKSMHQDEVVSRYKKIVDEYDISPDVVPIEITESAAVESIQIKPLADAFYEAGFSLHMDDFGSGHSSLNGLSVLHFDVVKFDKSLIDCIGGQRGELLLTYTMALGKELGLRLVAEGVENKTQLSFLMDNGCDVIQGYYYSRPLPECEFEQQLLENMEQHADDAVKVRPGTGSTGSVMKRTLNRMLQHMPGGFFTYEAGGEERILSSNQYLWNLFGCKTEEEFMEHVGGSFRGIVCPEEREQVETSIQQQIAGNTDDMDCVEYHIVRKDGSRIPVMDYGHLNRQEDGDIYYVFIIQSLGSQ